MIEASSTLINSWPVLIALTMYLDLELDSSEVLADRYDPADEQAARSGVSTAELAAWEADPWF